MDEVTGILERKFYENEEGAFYGLLQNNIFIRGTMADYKLGLNYTFFGKWLPSDKKTGQKRFGFESFKKVAPSTEKALQRYLSSHAKWIGPQISKNLFDAYGKNCLKICKENPERVAKEIKGLTLTRSLDIKKMLVNNEKFESMELEVRQIMSHSLLPNNMTQKIIKRFGGESLEILKTEPYSLVDEVAGLGFKKVDALALNSLGFERDSPARIRKGVVETLVRLSKSGGHTCYPLDDLLDEVSDFLKISRKSIHEIIDTMVFEKTLIKQNLTRKSTRVKTIYIYLKKLYEDESYVAKKLLDLLSAKSEVIPTPGDYAGLAPDQVDALTKAVESNVFILTGAPGTGKTFTITRVLSCFSEADFALCAPTGKAAKRVTEQTHHPATTIHKLLEPINGGAAKFTFSRDEDFYCDEEVFVIDESSMLDISLTASLLKAIPLGSRVIFVGDFYQLPSVGAGNVLKDLLSSNKIPATELTLIKRQSPGLIIQNCHKIKNNETDLLTVDTKNNPDMIFYDSSVYSKSNDLFIQSQLLDLALNKIPVKYSADWMKDCQIISPVRERGDLSCLALNGIIQSKMVKLGVEKVGDFKVGDKVIQTKNDYGLKITNGDIGYIVSKVDNKTMAVEFTQPTRVVEIPIINNNLLLAYSITCHKFQGSEADYIFIPISKNFPPMLVQRNWLYTAVSRAKKLCVLVGDLSQLPSIISREDQAKRYSLLSARLKKLK